MKRIIIAAIFMSFLFPKTSNDELVIDIERSLMSPCCWSGTVYDHGNSKMEAEIESFVEQGKTKDQILDYYVGLYGERILATPVASGFNLFAWIAPIVIAGIGIFILVMYIRSPKETQPDVVLESDEIPYSDQIEKDLEEMD